MMALVVLAACSEAPFTLPDADPAPDAAPDARPDARADAEPDGDASEMDAGDPDTGDPDAGDPDAGDPDAGDPDTGSSDAGVPCAQLQRDVCIATLGCVLDGSEVEDPGYFCRDAASVCETRKDQATCEGDGQCMFDFGGCYCPENVVCACAGGRAPICRALCGGVAGTPCDPGFFCDARPMPVVGDPCPGNADEIGTCISFPPACAGSGGGPVCGCDPQSNPVDYPNDCARRAAGATFALFGACP
jgi:hypothetical protein